MKDVNAVIHISRLICVGALVGAAVTAVVQGRPSAQPSGTPLQADEPMPKISDRDQVKQRAGSGHADSRFVMQAAEGGLKEVEAGRIAAQQASDAQVKQFGQKMVEDHSKANEELKSIARRKRIELPDETDAKAKVQALLGRLEKEEGTAFDKAYMNEMVKDHEKTVALFEDEAKSGQDPELQAFANKTLPTLRDHLQMARELQTAMASRQEP